MIVLASAGGKPAPAIARLVQTDEDTIRQVIHRFNESRRGTGHNRASRLGVGAEPPQ